MTPHHDHMGANAHYGRAFVKYGGNIRRPADVMMPAINDEHDGWWIYSMVPEAFLKYEEYTKKHIAGCRPGDKGAITIKLLLSAEESAYVPIASGLRVLEHIATLGAAALGKVPPFTPRSQPQICALWLRWGTFESGQQHEEMSEEEANARFAAGRKVQAEKAAEKAREKAEKAAARQAAREAREAEEAREKEEKAAARQAEKVAREAAREAHEADKAAREATREATREARAAKEAQKAAAREAAREASREALAAKEAQKAAARGAPLGLTAEQAIEAAKLEGLQLVPADNDTGFKGVYRTGIMYQGLVKVLGIKSHLGIFATREEAALHVARHKAEAEYKAAAGAGMPGSSRKRRRS
jgi:colicin import membrane protein